MADADEIPAGHPPSWRGKTPVSAGELLGGDLLATFDIVRIGRSGGTACGVGMRGYSDMSIEDFVEAMNSIKTMADAMIEFVTTSTVQGDKVAGMALYTQNGRVYFDRPM